MNDLRELIRMGFWECVPVCVKRRIVLSQNLGLWGRVAFTRHRNDLH